MASCQHVEDTTEKSGNDGDDVVVEEAEVVIEAAEEVRGGGAAGGGGHGLEVGPGGLLDEAVADRDLFGRVGGGGGGVDGGVGRRKHVSEGSVGTGEGGFHGDKFQACCFCELRRR